MSSKTGHLLWHLIHIIPVIWLNGRIYCRINDTIATYQTQYVYVIYVYVTLTGH